MLLAPGDKVDRYVVVELLGRGGMGEVYRARDPKLARSVALKILNASARAPGTDGAARLLREARAAAALSHANVLAVFDVGEVQEPESLRGLPYIAMELVAGRSLRAHIDAGGVSVERRIGWLRDVAHALAAAHRVGIVHRDVKPENVMIRAEDGVVKVLDFGIARQGTASNDAWASTLGRGTGGSGPIGSGPSTEAGAIVGTPYFMSPEQLRGEDLDGRSDQFSWGVTAYVLLTGRMPWAGANELISLVSQILSADAPPPSQVESRISLAVSDAIMRALSKRREDRFASMDDLVAAMDEKRSPPQASIPPTLTRSAPSPSAVTLAGVPSVTRRRPLSARRVATLALGCAALACGVAAYRAARAPRVRYCLGFEMVKSGPRCVAEVGPEVVGKRFLPVSRVTERAGRVDLVEMVNLAGIVNGGYDAPFSRMEVVRDDAGAVLEIVEYSHFGECLARQKWSNGGTRIDSVDLDGKTPRRFDQRVTTLRVEYDAQGRRTKVLFFGPTGRPRPGDDLPIDLVGGGVYGVLLEYRRTPGVVVKQTSLGADGFPAPSSEGIAFARRGDDGTLWGDVSVFDANDRPIAPKGVHMSRTPHDAYGPTGTSYFGVRDEPATNLERSFHEERVVWDPAKRTREWSSLDDQGRPQVLRHGGYVALRRTYDSRGRQTLGEFLDGQGNGVTVAEGASAYRTEYDDHDFVVAFSSLDPSGAPMQNESGCARMDRKTNPHDYPIDDRCYDERGHLTPWSKGGEISRATYDERDLQLTWSSYDANDHPVATASGFALERNRYDHLRNLVETAYFDGDGRPAIGRDGVAIKRLQYDDDDDLVATSYFDATGAPTLFESSYATQRLENDPRGLVVGQAYLDGHGDPVLLKDGYASVKMTRDRNGDVVEEAFFGKDGAPILHAGRFARQRTTFDVTRRPTEVALFGVAGEPVRGAQGWAVERTTYDERGLVVRVDDLDTSGVAVVGVEGRASIVKVNDARGNTTEETSLDAAGKPVVTSDGYATKRTTYGARDEVVEEALLGADGNPLAGKAGWSVRRVRDDEHGSLAEEAFFGASREPVVPHDLAYASMRQQFDERHRLVESAYFDVRGAPSKGPDGVATVRYKRDAYGRAIETAYFDGMGVAAPSKSGSIVVHSTFDDAGRLVAERFTDASGSPRAAADGCFGHQTKYDPLGHELEASCIDAAGAPSMSADGWSARRTLHDARGNDVEIATYAPSGAPHGDKDGIARRRSRFDDRNHVVETTYFDASDHPTHDANGVHALRFTYDDSGKETGESAVDEHERRVVTATNARPHAP